MHDRTRRTLCRLGFLLLGLLPTLGTAAGIGVLRSSWYRAAQRAAWERQLTDALGLAVTVQAVSTPTRGTTLLEGLELTDPETRVRVVRVRQVECLVRGGEWLLLAAQPEVAGDQLWRLWEVVHERFLRAGSAAHVRLQVMAGEVTLQRPGAQGAATLTGVRCGLQPTPEGPQVLCEFRDVALPAAEPAQLRVTRNRQQIPPATRWELQTRATALPCSLLADQVPVLERLGAQATFQGTLTVTQTGDGWEGQLAGAFRAVDLDRLVTDQYPHKLSGAAEIAFREARFRGSKLLEAAGELVCHGGQVSWSLLDQADRALGLSADPRVRALEADVQWRYQELQFGFTLDGQGLTLVGTCAGALAGVVMTDHQGPLLTDKPQEVATVALVRALASPHGESVPASAEAYQLLHVLPIPARPPTPTAAPPTRRPHTPLRLR